MKMQPQVLKSEVGLKMGFDVHQVRKDFPILAREIHGKPLVYLDSTATTQKPEAVLDALDHYYRTYNANVHRGVYQISEEATDAMEKARSAIAKFIKSPSSKQIIFTRNATEAINLVAYTWGEANIMSGDTILLTEMEHHSNIVPWQLLAQRKGARLEFVTFTKEGLLDQSEFEQKLKKHRPKLAAFTHMSNVLGTINPVRDMIAMAKQYGAATLIDGAQSVPHMPVDVQELDTDFLVFSGHKMCGPTGIGVLYGKRDLLENMPPFLGGGEMIQQVHHNESTWNDLPWKFEAGTPAIAEAIGLGAAVEYLNKIGMDCVREHEIAITEYALKRIKEVPGITVLGPDAVHRGGVISFVMDEIHSHDLAHILDSEGVCVRAGHHCAQLIMRKLDLASTTRASFYIYTLPEEVDALVNGLLRAREIFKL